MSVRLSRAPVSSCPSTTPGTGPSGCPSQAPVHRAEAPCGPSPAELSSWYGASYGPLPRCPEAVRDPDLLRKLLSFSSPHLSWELWCRHGGSSRLSQPHLITHFLQETFQGRSPAWSQLGCPRLCWLPPSEAKAAGSGHAAREPKIGHLISGLHGIRVKGLWSWSWATAGSQQLRGSGPPPARHFAVGHPTWPSQQRRWRC